MKILVDMNLSPAWVKFLADAGYIPERWCKIGRKSISVSPTAKESAISEIIRLPSSDQ
jgi:predicted nuclease of predicted toxin-antitoxin system